MDGMSETASWTIGRLLQWTTDYLKEHGAESPRLDAEVLLAHARGCQRIDLYTQYSEVADERLRETFRDLVKRRAAGTPVAYLVGRREFYSKSFLVSPAVLIPRPETEFVLIALLDRAKSYTPASDRLRVADVGTGSGNLAICAALQLPQAQVTALDISEAALEVARSNAECHRVSDRIRFVPSDLFDALDASERFDFIISNPPYVALADRPQLARDVVDYEPHQALFAGERGLDVLARLIPAAVDRLVPHGWLISEIDPRQRDDVRQIVAENAAYEPPEFVDDLSRQPRVLAVRRAAVSD
jgi:release factor glutamine methyltransferase